MLNSSKPKPHHQICILFTLSLVLKKGLQAALHFLGIGGQQVVWEDVSLHPAPGSHPLEGATGLTKQAPLSSAQKPPAPWASTVVMLPRPGPSA